MNQLENKRKGEQGSKEGEGAREETERETNEDRPNPGLPEKKTIKADLYQPEATETKQTKTTHKTTTKPYPNLTRTKTEPGPPKENWPKN